MNPSIKHIITALFLMSYILGMSQTDSLKILTYDNFLSVVKKNHPVAKQADLISKNADALLLNAKGNFDPKLFYDFNQKEFNDKNYWTISDGGFKIPTWFGIELSGGFEQNNGIYLNPENTSPQQGLVYSQISLPIGQGLFIDERRAILKQAKLFKELSEFEKNNLINNILLDAGKTYWDWYLAYQNVSVFKNAVAIAKQRLDAVISSAKLGDRPYIDTLEASIQYQERMVNLQQSEIEFKNKSYTLSNYLWLEDDIPIEITEQIIPSQNSNIENNNVFINNSILKIDSITNIHPQLKVYDYKLKQLNVEQRLKKEKLKPVLNVSYNPLFEQTNNIYNENYFMNNYKYGVNFSFPIFLRKERGDLRFTQIKIQDTKYEQLNKQNEIKNRIKASINEYQITNSQISIYNNTVNDYEKLLDSEKTLFTSGESSLFMVNSREMSYINAQLKLNEYINKNKKAVLNTIYAFGQLYNVY